MSYKSSNPYFSTNINNVVYSTNYTNSNAISYMPSKESLSDIVIGFNKEGVYVIKNRYGTNYKDISALDLFRIAFWLMSGNYNQVIDFLST